MIGRSKRFLQALGAVLANRHETIRQTGSLFAADPIEAFTNGGRNCRGHGFPGSLGQFLGQPMSLGVFYVQTHFGYLLPREVDHSTKITN
jgi:hypothetical protein